MKKLTLKAILFLCMHSIGFSQVGIGTTTPDNSAILQLESTTGAFIPPRMTNAEMLAIPTPLDGAMVFNTTNNSHYTYKNSSWSSIENNVVVINKDFSSGNNAISTNADTYYDFPIGPADVLTTNTDVYNVTSNGTITILKSGNYMFSASFSLTNMPSGSHKYVVALTINSVLSGYLTRGSSSLPSTDYWGRSGNIMLPINANDEIKIRYVLNNGGAPLDAKFANIGITKLN